MLPLHGTGTCGKAEAVLNAFSVLAGIATQIELFADLHEEKVKLSSTEVVTLVALSPDQSLCCNVSSFPESC